MRQDYTRCWTAVLRPLFYCKHQGALTQYPCVTLTLASLKDIITQIKTLLLLNKRITSERDSLDCSICRPLEAIRSWAVHVLALRQPPSCQCMWGREVFYVGWKIFSWPDKRHLIIYVWLYTSWARVSMMWQWCHGNSHFKINVCFYPATMWVSMDTANTTHGIFRLQAELIAWNSSIPNNWCQHWKQLDPT